MSNNLDNLPIDHDIYKQLSKISYTEHIPIPKLINDMLREHLNVYLLWRKVGYTLVSKDVLKSSLAHISNDELIESARKVADRYKEAAILLHGHPSIEAYLGLIRSFVAVNGYSVEKSKNGENDVLIIQFNMNEKYSSFLGNAYRILFEEVAKVHKFEITKNLVFIEYRTA